MHDFAGLALVVWSTQPVIRPQTFARAVKLARLFDSYEMVLPTAFIKNPYAPIARNQSGEIASAVETHLEDADPHDFGETNIGLFLVKNQTMFQVLQELRNRYWDESTGRYTRARGELGFPNELINALASRKFGVCASPFADPREEQGIKRLEDVWRCEKFISELKAEKTTGNFNNGNDGK
jgi:bifunctional N-acetylglucosamine-1-phosphate-uridyltransferase/glucosamine-1-phosphate-acetyltransferase GlmU-like protein